MAENSAIILHRHYYLLKAAKNETVKYSTNSFRERSTVTSLGGVLGFKSVIFFHG
jgi:hypothetical protein